MDESRQRLDVRTVKAKAMEIHPLTPERWSDFEELFGPRGAVDYVREKGGRMIEAYPTVPRKGKLPPVSSFMGFPGVFARVGFVECARPSEARMIMRIAID